MNVWSVAEFRFGDVRRDLWSRAPCTWDFVEQALWMRGAEALRAEALRVTVDWEVWREAGGQV